MKGYSQAGFSLLELLVALFVIVIITSLVTLAINSGGQDISLDAKVKSLADISSFAMDEAQMRAVDMGLLIQQVDEGGERLYRYGWRERSPRGWRRPEVDKDIFADKTFPASVEVVLELEDTRVQFHDGVDRALAGEGKPAEVAPQVVFYASGEVTVGYIELQQRDSGDLLWRIEWDLLGRFTLLRKGEAADE
jgi:prepilin-type N-terminal cleavage/methylation domain-containing protein